MIVRMESSSFLKKMWEPSGEASAWRSRASFKGCRSFGDSPAFGLSRRARGLWSEAMPVVVPARPAVNGARWQR